MEFGHAINSLIGLSFVAIPLMFLITSTIKDNDEKKTDGDDEKKD